MYRISRVCLLAMLLSACATIISPVKQRVRIYSDNDSSSIFVHNGYRDEHKSYHTGELNKRIEKAGPRQVRVETPGFTDEYLVLLPCRRPVFLWFVQPLNVFTLFAGNVLDFYSPKTKLYQKRIYATTDKNGLIYRDPEREKLILPGNYSVNLSDKELDNLFIRVKFSSDPQKLSERMKRSEEKAVAAILKKRVKIDGTVRKKRLSEEYVSITDRILANSKQEAEAIKVMSGLINLMVATSYTDTMDFLYHHHHTAIRLEPVVKKIRMYEIKGTGQNYFYRLNLSVDWQVRSVYGSLLATYTLESFSGDFLNAGPTLYTDALKKGYLQLLRDEEFKIMLQLPGDIRMEEAFLRLKLPQTPVKDRSEVAKASLIVTTGSGHGSGFAVTNDGYVITNYHVVAGVDSLLGGAVEVMDGLGNKYPAKVVRVNVVQDLALLKVEKELPLAFLLPADSSFFLKQKVYTVGAPVSIELGQTFSQGSIMRLRNFNGIPLIQMKMAVNPGNSGGPVFDITGNLHGVVVSKMIGEGADGISFAIPAHKIMEYLNISY